MTTGIKALRRVLVAIPAFNEAAMVESVVRGVRASAPHFDLLVVNDGSEDSTAEILARIGAPVATHLCNLGYSRSVQTAIRYAQRCGYDAVITCDADGQHRPTDLERLHDAFVEGGHDLLIGSRFLEGGNYGSAPLARRLGMWFFSAVIRCLTGRRICDPSSGLKVIGRSVFDALVTRPVVDFHAETLVYLIQSGYSVGEYPVSVDPRKHGSSMYTSMSVVTYPLKVLFLTVLSVVDARRRASRRSDD